MKSKEVLNWLAKAALVVFGVIFLSVMAGGVAINIKEYNKLVTGEETRGFNPKKGESEGY